MELLLHSLIKEIAAKMPELSLIDKDYGQLENIDEDNKDMYPITFPCVLLDAPSVDWSYIQGNSQKGEATIRVRLIIDCYDDTHFGSDTTHKIIERHEMVKQLHEIVQGFRSIDDGALMRKRSRFFTFNHGIKVYEAEYTCTVTDVIQTMTVNPSKVSFFLKTGSS
ncbi:hypothetical protein [Bacteroides heparinolyticus]|uniref:hypothetical protein n=1 Tax=Prevotella heparinolytica TaxID=28113 RepID=UPI0035A1C5A9